MPIDADSDTADADDTADYMLILMLMLTLCPIFLNRLHHLLLLVEKFPEEDVFLPSSDNIPRFLACPAHTNPHHVQQSLHPPKIV